jgi:hypothetical protein
MNKIPLRDFFEELQNTTTISMLDIVSKKDTNLTRLATCYAVAYLCEIEGFDCDTAGTILGIKEEECLAIFKIHDSKYYDNGAYRQTYDKILGRISSYGVFVKRIIEPQKKEVVQRSIFSLPDFLI